MTSNTQSAPDTEVYEFPASSGQAAQWVMHQMMPQNPAYNIPLVVRISGQLNTEALERSVRAMLERHEVLRTRYADKGGALVQNVYSEINFDFVISDVSAEQDSLQQADKHIAEAVSGQFDLAGGNSFRSGVISVGEDAQGEQQWLFYFVVHHIAVDHGAMLLIAKEISALYSSFIKGEEISLPEPELQYVDYVMWLQENQGDLQDKVDAWHEHLQGLSGVLGLPTDRRRPAMPSGDGAEYRFSLSPELSEKVIQFTRSQGVTLYITCLAAFKVLMARYSNQEDIVVGTPFSFRGEQEELGDVIGCFMNTLPVASIIDQDMSFNSLLASIKKTMLFAYEHQDVPFDAIVAAELKTRDFSVNPLFQVGFVFQEPPPQVSLEGLNCEIQDVHTGGAMYDIHQWMWELNNQLHGVMWYSKDIYDLDSIKHMQACYEVALASLIVSPDTPIWQADILSQSDINVLDELAAIKPVEGQSLAQTAPLTTTFPALFSQQAAQQGDKVAAIFANGEQLSYTSLDTLSSQMAAMLVAEGVAPGDFIGICMSRTQHMLVALLGVMKAGATYIPLDPAYPVDRLSFMVETSDAKLVIANDEALATANSIANQVLNIEARWGELADFSETFQSLATPETLSYVIFTSGSTGKPKGVQITHGSMLNLLGSTQSWPGFSEDNRLLAVTTLSFDIAVLDLYLPLLSGGSLVVASTEQAKDSMVLKDLIAQHDIDYLQATPVTWRGLVAADFVGGDNFKVLCGGEAFPQDLARELVVRCGQVWNMYGPTEITIYASGYRLPPTAEPILIGKPIANTQCYVLDERLQRVPVGVEGELFVGGFGVAPGYLGRPDLTAERFIETDFSDGKLYRTGDAVRITPCGQIEYINRIDNQVKLRGFRIELGEIESVLSTHEAVAQAILKVCRFSEIDDRMVAYVVLNEGFELDEKALVDHMRQSLPDYMLPQTIMPMQVLPTTSSGKIDRNALPVPQWESDQSEIELPQSTVAKEIAALWSEILMVEEVGANTDFFSLGGHSLLAVSMLLTVNKRYDSDIRVRDFITDPTVNTIASLLEGDQSQSNRLTVDEIERPAQLPMSSAQRRLWYIEQFTEQFSTYNITLTYDCDAVLDSDRVQQCLSVIGQRHESLRTLFQTDGEQWLQIIHEGDLFGWQQDDISVLNSAEQQETLAEKQHHYSRCKLDFENGPLWRAELTVIGENHCRLYFVFHHTIFDGISADIFIDEFVQCYAALEENREPQLKALPFHYADYVLWQQQQVETELIQQQYAYWKDKLGGDLPVLNLPADYSRPAELDYLGDTCQLSLPGRLIEDLNSVANQSQCSLFVLLMAAYQLLLRKYTQQDDLLVGCPVAERGQREFSDTIGFLVNTLVLRTRFDDLETLSDLLNNVRTEWYEGMAHSDVTFDDLVEQIQPVRDVSHSPIFQTMFAYQKIDCDVIDMAGKSLTMQRPRQTTARTDITFWLHHLADSIEINCEYSSSIYSRRFAQQFLESYQALLEQIAQPNSAALRLTDITALSPAMAQSLDSFSVNADGFKDNAISTLSQLIDRHASTTPDAIAVRAEAVAGESTLSYQQLEQRSNALAVYLSQCGVKRGDYVGIALNRHIDLLVGLLGIVKAGAAYVPLDPDYPKDRLAYMLEHADVALLLTESSLVADLPAFSGNIVSLDEQREQLASLQDQQPSVETTADDIAYVIFTSGSTGLPKGVKVPHGAVMNFLYAMQQQPGFTADNSLLAVTTLSFDIAVLELYLPLFSGGTTVIASREQAADAISLMELMDENNITVMQATPSTWRMLLDSGWSGKADLKVLCGGEAFPQDLAGQLLPAIGELWNMYGPTETTVWSTCYNITDGDAPIYIGKPIRNTTCYVLDDEFKPVPPGVLGELYIGGDGVTQGYLGRDDLTAERFPVDPFFNQRSGTGTMYRTGDKVRWRYDGELEYFNRADNQVKVRGFRIELGEIETCLLKHDSISDGVVVLQQVDTGPRLVAFYTLVEGHELSVMQLRQFLSQSLPRYMLPNHFVEQEELPLTPSGKIDRKLLAQRTGDNLATGGASYKAPSSVTEQYYASVWGELLDNDKVSVEDNFFDIGGHSLMAMQVVTRINREKGVNVELRSLLMNTLEQIANQYPLEEGDESHSSDSSPSDAAASADDSAKQGGLAGMIKRIFK